MGFPDFVKLVEVGPRDGLQNEPQPIPCQTKIELIDYLSETGLSCIEVTSFVSPKWIRQLADAKTVYQGITKKPEISYPVLIPNLRGMQDALGVGVDHIAIFTAASERFCKKNTNCSIEESFARMDTFLPLAKERNLPVRGYVSCVLGCPYEGDVPIEKVAEVAKTLYDKGCYEISLGDTIGIGTAKNAQRLVEAVAKEIPLDKIAVHFHDTYAQALTNIYAVLELGVSIVDCSVAGLGGCPYAEGASGNVATEDVLYLLNGMDIPTGVDMLKLLKASRFVTEVLGHPARSRVARAMIAKLRKV